MGQPRPRGTVASVKPPDRAPRLGLLALDQPMDRVEMLLRLALAAQRFVELGGIAMRLNRGGVAIERAQETTQRRLMLLALAVEQPKPPMDLRAGRNDRSGTEQMAQRALKIALALEQSGKAHMRFEITRLPPDQIAVDRERLQRVPFGNAARLFEPFTDAGGAKALFDLAAWAVGAKIEQKLAGFGFDQYAVVADYYAAFVIDQFERGNRAAGVDQVNHPPKAALQWFQMSALAQQILRQPHDEQIVECKAVLAPGRSSGIDEPPLDPIANSVGGNRENSRGRARRECTTPSYRLA